MYTILNERGTNKEGRIVYDVFGVGLANTLSMMLLTGETSYYNDKTKSIPIVMGGEESKISDSYQFKRNLKKK